MWAGIPCPYEEHPTNNVPDQRCRRKYGDDGHFGDIFKCTKGNYRRISLQNTGGIGFVSGKRSIETLKIECLKKEFIESDINIVGLMEVNKDWINVPNESTI